MKIQRAAAALAFAAGFALGLTGASGMAQAHPRHHAYHHAHHRHAHHPRAAHRPVSKHIAMHFSVMNAGGMEEINLPVDGTTTVNGVEAGCTGIGIETRKNPRWKDFPVRVEFSGAYSQYFPGGQLVVKDEHGAPLLNLHCDSPWILLRLEPGKYRLAGVMAGYSRPQSWVMKLKPRRTKTRRIVFHFREIKGSEP
jgi:hypothetical protein